MWFRRSALWFIVALAVIMSAALWSRRHIEAVDVGVDDANIFFVYARNLASGHGLVWNIGGPRVEGFSSPLWLLMMTPLFAMMREPEFPLFLLSVILVSLGFAAWVGLFARRAPDRRLQSPIPILVVSPILWLLWCFTQPMFLVWTTLTLMETGLWCAIALMATAAAAWSALRPNHQDAPWLLWALVPLILLARPEGMMWAGVLIAAEATTQLLVHKPMRAWIRHSMGSLLIYAFSLGAITAFRLAYFGFPLPNTYYAKVSPDRAYSWQIGWGYFVEFIRSHHLLPFLIGSVCVTAVAFTICVFIKLVIRVRGSKADHVPIPSDVAIAFVTSVAILAGLLAPILVGGDHFDGFRFYQPIWPLLPFPLLFFLRYALARLVSAHPVLQTRTASIMATSIALAALAGFVLPDAPSWKNIGRRRLVDEFRLARDGRNLGHALNRVFEGDQPEVGAIAVGGIQFAYRGWVNDLMGLSNIEMAHYPGERKGIKNHAAFSKDVFFKQQPPVMVPVAFPFRASDYAKASMPPEFLKYINHRWVIEPLQGLPRDTMFRALYKPALVSRTDSVETECIGAFYRNDFLASLQTNAIYEVAVFEL